MQLFLTVTYFATGNKPNLRRDLWRPLTLKIIKKTIYIRYQKTILDQVIWSFFLSLGQGIRNTISERKIESRKKVGQPHHQHSFIPPPHTHTTDTTLQRKTSATELLQVPVQPSQVQLSKIKSNTKSLNSYRHFFIYHEKY